MNDEKDDNYWFRFILKLIYRDELKELRNQIKEQSKYKFTIPLAKSNNKNIRLLYENDYKMPRESINLLHQANITLKSTKLLLGSKRIVDTNTLIRSSFEYILMGMMTYFNGNVYEEYKKLGLKLEDRKFTKIQQLINRFKTKLKIIDNELFSIYNNRMLGKILTDFYDKLCLYTHSSLVVNGMIEAKINGDEDFFIVIAKQNVLFLEILLNICLKYITKDKSFELDYIYIFVVLIFMYYEIDYEKYTTEYIQKYKYIMYIDLNKDFFEKDIVGIDAINNMVKYINEIIGNNPEEFIKTIKELVGINSDVTGSGVTKFGTVSSNV